MKNSFSFNINQFNKLFPFYILFNQKLEVESVGVSLEKIFPNTVGQFFSNSFSFKRPQVELIDYDAIASLINQLIIVECKNLSKTSLRGQVEVIEETNQLLFIGSPWFDSMEEVLNNDLLLKDFAHHDPMIDLLHVLKNQEIATSDLKQLLLELNKQKEQLKKANREISDIALFPTQDPDPIFRVNLQGDLLNMNPAGEKLIQLEFNNKYYYTAEFFKHIFPNKFTLSNWSFEASSNNRDYSFACLLVPEKDYINIYGRDITQQTKDKKELEIQSTVANATNNGVAFMNDDVSITWVNQSFEKITGFSAKELIGLKPNEIFIGELSDKAVWERMINGVLNKKPFSEEFVHYKKDGTWFWAKVQYCISRDEDDTIKNHFVILEDISSEKQREDQLRILSSIAAENTNAVVIADKYGRIEWTNKSFEKITGYTLEEVKGRKPGHILQGPETNLETINYIKRQITSGEPFVCEILNYHKTGSKYWLRLQGQALKDVNGKVIKYFAIEEDITKEKQYKQNLKDFEARFRLALEKIGDNVWEHDFRTGKTIFSKTYNSFLGTLDEQNKNLEEHWRNSVHKDDLWKIISNEQNYKDAKIDSHSTEYRIVQNDGSVKWVLDRGVIIEKDKDGKPLLLIGTHTDISSQKTIEQELIVAKEAAEASTNAKEMFLANMSHEIRTPMNAIVGMANQMSKTKLDNNQQFYLGNIQSAADNLLIVINDILDLSKIEAGKLTLEHIAFQPNQVLERAMIVMMHKAEEKGLSLINSYNDEKLANVLIGDPYRLNQILLNLLSNAIKFTEKGIVDIDCEVVKNDESNQIIKLSVTDSGIGMDEAFIKILFQKFSQEDESVTRKFGGTGLGMSICKNLVELMNGDIEVFSKKGVGTTVVVTIPFEKGNTAMLPIKGTETVNTNLLAGKKILVADDNEMNRLVASSILEQYQSIIIEAENGQEAVDKMRNEYFDIVLMDVQMPVMDGIEATKEIRRTISENVPIIALTAMALKGDDVRLIKEGMSDYLSKPFDEAQLLNIISRWLGK